MSFCLKVSEQYLKLTKLHGDMEQRIYDYDQDPRPEIIGELYEYRTQIIDARERLETLLKPDAYERFQVFEKKAVDFVKKLVEAGELSVGDALSGLTGVDSLDVWEWRKEESRQYIFSHSLYRGLAGLYSNRSFQFRTELMKKIRASSRYAQVYLIEGLAGVDTPAAFSMRRDALSILKKSFSRELEVAIMRSLAGIDMPEAWAIRTELRPFMLRETVVASLCGLTSEESWELRDEFFTFLQAQHRWDVDDGEWNGLYTSMIGDDSDRAWHMRDGMKSTLSLLTSIAGCGSERAWAVRRGFFTRCMDETDDDVGERREMGAYLAESLTGLNTPEAWKMRTELLKLDIPQSVCDGILGTSTTFVWQLPYIRNRIAREKNGEVFNTDIEA